MEIWITLPENTWIIIPSIKTFHIVAYNVLNELIQNSRYLIFNVNCFIYAVKNDGKIQIIFQLHCPHVENINSGYFYVQFFLNMKPF